MFDPTGYCFCINLSSNLDSISNDDFIFYLKNKILNKKIMGESLMFLYIFDSGCSRLTRQIPYSHIHTSDRPYRYI